MDKILEIADKNGFIYEPSTVHAFERYQGGGYTAVSLADLATNKSFLEALGRTRADKLFSSAGIMPTCDPEDVQIKLIRNITYNNGDNFAEICRTFIGEVE